MKVFVVSGYFINGFTTGHIEMLKSVRKLMKEGDLLVAVVNNEMQQSLKYKTARRKFWEINEKICPVLDDIFPNFNVELSHDRDRTIRETLKYIKSWYLGDEYIFVNDGDVTEKCPEEEVKDFKFIYLGNKKISSSGEEKNE